MITLSPEAWTLQIIHTSAETQSFLALGGSSGFVIQSFCPQAACEWPPINDPRVLQI